VLPEDLTITWERLRKAFDEQRSEQTPEQTSG
jgi:hypothetical protein